MLRHRGWNRGIRVLPPLARAPESAILVGEERVFMLSPILRKGKGKLPAAMEDKVQP